jgi:hypothetical protein
VFEVLLVKMAQLVQLQVTQELLIQVVVEVV